MAPEMVLMLSRNLAAPDPAIANRTKQQVQKGYTHAVDWWSLGVTTYRLLTGMRPFTDARMHSLVEMASTMAGALEENTDFSEYSKLFQKIEFPDNKDISISEEARDFITQLLNVNDEDRLGFGPKGTENVKKHPFFRGIDWDAMNQRQVIPPYRPEVYDVGDEFNLAVSDLRTLLSFYEKEHLIDAIPPAEDQKYFDRW
jgi:serine/threonine protein kinase